VAHGFFWLSEPKHQESDPTPGFDYGEGGYDGVRRSAMDVRELDNCIVATSVSLNLAETAGREVETSLHFRMVFPSSMLVLDSDQAHKRDCLM
jgi:hypothetical protein